MTTYLIDFAPCLGTQKKKNMEEEEEEKEGGIENLKEQRISERNRIVPKTQ